MRSPASDVDCPGYPRRIEAEAEGEGDMDYRAIAETLCQIGFQGDAVIELAHERDFQPTRPLRESLRISRQFVRETMGY
jgi:sugar phosphate isomerase/epimerase